MRCFFQILTLAVPSAITFCCFYPYRRKALRAMQLDSSILREIFLIIYVMLLSGIVALKLCPVYWHEPTSGIWGDIELLISRPAWDTMLNYIPFSMFVDYFKCWIEYGTSDISSIVANILGNLVVFIPVGFLSASLFRNITWKHCVFIGLALSLITEFGQYFIMRNTSIDDVILNTVGSILGYWLYRIVLHFHPHFSTKLQCI